MAKKTYDVDTMFGELAERRKEMKKEAVVEEPIVEEVVINPTETNFQVSKQTRKQGNKETRKQGNKEKIKTTTGKKEYYYGTKRTHAYPDELWRKFDIILKMKGEKQNAKLIEFVTAYVEENIEIVEMWEKMQSVKK